jgi:hypothetical protein
MIATNKRKAWASVKGIVLIFLLIYFPSCYAPQIQLSPKEEKLCAALAAEYQCEVHLFHDARTVSDNKNDGTFDIRLESNNVNLCSKDSSYFRITSAKIADNVIGIMSHKKNYRSINVVFEVIKNTGKDSYQTLCSRELNIGIADTALPAITDWWTWDAPKWTPSEHIIEK